MLIKKVTELTADTAPSADDLIMTINSPASSPANRKVTFTTLFGTIPAPIKFADLGTATRAIDLSGSGLSGTDFLIYFSGTNYWDSSGVITISNYIVSPNIVVTDSLATNTDSNVGILGISNERTWAFGNRTGSSVGTYTDCTFPTANKDYINKTGIGTGTSVVGELAQVTGGTGATKDFYRIIALISADSIQVDRNIHNAGANITNGSCKIWKNIVSVHATDDTNGQMLTSWSAQNKPMQLGGTVLAATANSLTSTDIVMGGMTEFMGNTFFKAGSSTGYSTPVGAINVNTTAVGNVDAGEDVLMTYSLPSDALSANAKGIRVTVYGQIANNANAKTVKVYFGTTVVYTDAMTVNQAYNWYAQYTAIRTGVDTQDVFGSGFFENTACTVAPYYATDTQNDGAAIVIKCTGEGVASNDIIQQGMLIEYIN